MNLKPAIFLMTASGLLASEPISLSSLLKEMTDRTRIAKAPSPVYACKQFSSYSRGAESPDKGWFSNQDWSNFLRIETNNGRREYVMLDHRAPGAIVRFWMTFAKGGHDGILRFYIDGSDKPAIEGEAVDVLSGGQLAGAPLSSSSSEKSDYLRRGHNLYLPIPYAKSCKVTIEIEKLGKLNALNHAAGPFVYYNINYREYITSAEVHSFTVKQLNDNKTLIDQVNKTLLSPYPDTSTYQNKVWSDTIPAGEERDLYMEGPRAIKKIQVKLQADRLNQALRSTVLKIDFDGKNCVWIPVGEFFGTGYKISPYKSWYTEVKDDGTMSASWVMPFSKDCRTSLVNHGDQDVSFDAVVSIRKKEWTGDSLYFHAGWFELNRLKTVGHSEHSGEGAIDVNFITLKGRGVYAGDSLTLFNGADKWWGEGDEKIFVDDEKFPSHFGTGTEDYYGYAWCRPEKFYTPFIAQPDGSGNLKPGFSVNSRYRLLDGIPFAKSFKLDMELWHWKACTMNYAPSVFYYATKATTGNAKRNIESVRRPVMLRAD